MSLRRLFIPKDLDKILVTIPPHFAERPYQSNLIQNCLRAVAALPRIRSNPGLILADSGPAGRTNAAHALNDQRPGLSTAPRRSRAGSRIWPRCFGSVPE